MGAYKFVLARPQDAVAVLGEKGEVRKKPVPLPRLLYALVP